MLESPLDPPPALGLPMMIVKKYSNRRLYDTEDSRYITLDELAEKIRRGTDVRVVDASSGDDLTQATLTQIILETGTAKLLPVALLTRLIRMRDDALGEFFTHYMTAALDMYMAAKQNVERVAPLFPFGNAPYAPPNPFLAMFQGGWANPMHGSRHDGGHRPPPGSPPPPTRAVEAEPEDDSPPRSSASKDELSELRKEMEALKKEMRKKKR